MRFLVILLGLFVGYQVVPAEIAINYSLQQDMKFIIYTGIVTDNNSKHYHSSSFGRKTNISTITNADGEFSLKFQFLRLIKPDNFISRT